MFCFGLPLQLKARVGTRNRVIFDNLLNKVRGTQKPRPKWGGVCQDQATKMDITRRKRAQHNRKVSTAGPNCRKA